MARTFVQAGRRRQYTTGAINLAGHLVFNEGFYGILQDTVATAFARPAVMILDGVWDLPGNLFDASLINAGKKIYAVPVSSQASSLTLYHNAASLAASAVAIGRSWATAAAGASLVRTLLFGPENQY